MYYYLGMCENIARRLDLYAKNKNAKSAARHILRRLSCSLVQFISGVFDRFVVLPPPPGREDESAKN